MRNSNYNFLITNQAINNITNATKESYNKKMTQSIKAILMFVFNLIVFLLIKDNKGFILEEKIIISLIACSIIIFIVSRIELEKYLLQFGILDKYHDFDLKNDLDNDDFLNASINILSAKDILTECKNNSSLSNSERKILEHIAITIIEKILIQFNRITELESDRIKDSDYICAVQKNQVKNLIILIDEIIGNYKTDNMEKTMKLIDRLRKKIQLV